MRRGSSQNMVAASCTLEPSKASESIPCIRSSHSRSTPMSRSRKSPKGTAPGGFTSSPRVPVGIRHVVPSRTTASPRPTGHTITRMSRRRDPPRAPPARPDQRSGRGLSPPREGAWIAKLTFFHHANVVGSVRPRRRVSATPASRILAFRPECNPPARTTPASRTACDCKRFSPSPSTRGTVRQYSRRRWRTKWGRPSGAWRHQRTLLPVPLYTRSGSTTLKTPPPAKPLRARVTRCGHPRIGTRPTNHAPRANAGD